MIHQLKEYNEAILAIELSEGFTEADFNEIQKLAAVKREKGFDKANILLKLDRINISESNGKAVLEQVVKIVKHLKEFNKIAVVSDSSALAKLVKVDNMFLQLFNKGSQEKYFDVENLDAALLFVERNHSKKVVLHVAQPLR